MPARHPALAAALGPVRACLRGALGEHRRAVLACSGGPDSVALLGLVGLLHRDLGLDVTVAHVDHGLRPESAAEADQVRALADRLGFAFVVRTLSLARGPGLPARAREGRRAALADVAAGVGAEHVLLGHTATDRAETLLLHATRGAGLRGLGAMGPVVRDRGIVWVRPLLELSREQTEATCERMGLPRCRDPGNLDRTQPRIAMRLDVLPRLRGLNPAVERALGGLARQARACADMIDAVAATELDRRGDGSGRELDLRGWAELAPPLRLAILASFHAQAGLLPDRLRLRLLEQIDAAIVARVRRGGRDKRWDLHRRCIVLGRNLAGAPSLSVRVADVDRAANTPPPRRRAPGPTTASDAKAGGAGGARERPAKVVQTLRRGGETIDPAGGRGYAARTVRTPRTRGP